MKRVFLIVLDSCGIGAMPDAAAFGDGACHTLRRIAGSSAFSAATLQRLGLGNIDGVDVVPATAHPMAAVARMTERSAGKDTTIGHWEIAGVVSTTPLPTYPEGFPAEVLEAFSAATGRGVLCNRPYSGTQVIRDYGEEHVRTGDLIVYTSADSVFQVAAHEDVIPVETLYDYCRIARQLLQGVHGVGRVIARPFTGTAPDYTRTANRRDFSLEPPAETLLDALTAAGRSVLAVGKISDIFAGRGITERIPTHSNEEGMAAALALQSREFEGLAFINLVDFDMLYGHRQDVDGYAAALTAFDGWLPTFLDGMGPEDVLMITADHGCDPGDSHTDHTREYTPWLVYGPSVRPVNLGTRPTFADIAATVAGYLGVAYAGAGEDLTDRMMSV
ncbi:MAG: phosphopentomutase [Ruminococcaceae bacterium]|nr:phosphopentomutase [Oscillospiraceae bacterium]